MKTQIIRPPVRCYDNGGKTADRYTVYFLQPEIVRGQRFYSYLAMSACPFHPQGIGQHGETAGPVPRAKYVRNIGRRIEFSELPADCQRAVIQDLQEVC